MSGHDALKKWLDDLGQMYDKGTLQSCNFNYWAELAKARAAKVTLQSKNKAELCKELQAAVLQYRKLTSGKTATNSMQVDEPADKRKTAQEPQKSAKLNHNQLRLALAQMIKDKSFPLEPCLYTQNFDRLVLLPKTSASTTWISKAKMLIPSNLRRKYPLVRDNVILKIAFVPRNSLLDNSLESERRVYRFVNSLYVNGNTPHIVFFLAELKCNQFLQSIEHMYDSGNTHAIQFTTELARDEQTLEKLYDLQKLRILVTERSKGSTLRKTLATANQKAANSQESQKVMWQGLIVPVLFQVLYTLAAFADVGLQHNDLHTDNVFVDKLKKPCTDTYQVDDMCFQFNSVFFSRLYDFDRAAKSQTKYSKLRIHNTFLMQTMCPRFGQCQTLDSKADTFRFLHYLHDDNERSSRPNPFLRQWLFQVVPATLLNNHKRASMAQAFKKPGDLAWVGSLCMCSAAGCVDKCKMRTTYDLYTARELLEHSVFQAFRVACPTTVGTKQTNWTLPSNK